MKFSAVNCCFMWSRPVTTVRLAITGSYGVHTYQMRITLMLHLMTLPNCWCSHMVLRWTTVLCFCTIKLVLGAQIFQMHFFVLFISSFYLSFLSHSFLSSILPSFFPPSIPQSSSLFLFLLCSLFTTPLSLCPPLSSGKVTTLRGEYGSQLYWYHNSGLDLYASGSLFNSQQVHQLSWLRCSWFSSSVSMQMSA